MSDIVASLYIYAQREGRCTFFACNRRLAVAANHVRQPPLQGYAHA